MIQTKDEASNLLHICHFDIVKIEREIVDKKSRIEVYINMLVNNNNCLPSIKDVSKRHD
jgi:GTP cyclohydrolase III